MVLIIDFLNQISEYEIGNIDKLPTKKELRSTFSKMDFKEINNFLLSCDSQISEVQQNQFLTKQEKTDICNNVMVFYKFVKPLATKKLKESFNF
tara:strand:- start:255 stop:536 length:282 start_codon:yes stop_codon:yes gene_type:complete